MSNETGQWITESEWEPVGKINGEQWMVKVETFMNPRERIESAFNNSRTVTYEFRVYIDLAEIDARNERLPEYLQGVLDELGFREVNIELVETNR